jgi:hypothetical protein
VTSLVSSTSDALHVNDRQSDTIKDGVAVLVVTVVNLTARRASDDGGMCDRSMKAWAQAKRSAWSPDWLAR